MDEGHVLVLDYVSLPDRVAVALLKALSKRPEESFSSVGEFVTELCEIP
jgi:hypothetical protein